MWQHKIATEAAWSLRLAQLIGGDCYLKITDSGAHGIYDYYYRQDLHVSACVDSQQVWSHQEPCVDLLTISS